MQLDFCLCVVLNERYELCARIAILSINCMGRVWVLPQQTWRTRGRSAQNLGSATLVLPKRGIKHGQIVQPEDNIHRKEKDMMKNKLEGTSVPQKVTTEANFCLIVCPFDFSCLQR